MDCFPGQERVSQTAINTVSCEGAEHLMSRVPHLQTSAFEACCRGAASFAALQAGMSTQEISDAQARSKLYLA